MRWPAGALASEQSQSHFFELLPKVFALRTGAMGVPDRVLLDGMDSLQHLTEAHSEALFACFGEADASARTPVDLLAQLVVNFEPALVVFESVFVPIIAAPFHSDLANAAPFRLSALRFCVLADAPAASASPSMAFLVRHAARGV